MMTEVTVDTGRSSFVDIYQSDGGTNSDTINDFSQNSDIDNVKVNFQEKSEPSPLPFVEKNIPISSDNITFSPKPHNGIPNGIEMLNGKSSESEEEDDSRFEITKKKTIRTIISRTTSINGVEKENEVKEFLIKDSQVNDDGSPFSKSRRGSHVSMRRPSVDSRVGRGKSKSERSHSKVDFGDLFKSDLEKINDVECEDKKVHCEQGLCWVAPYEAIDEEREVIIPVRVDEVNIEERIEERSAGKQLESKPEEANYCPSPEEDSRKIKSDVDVVKWVNPMRSYHLKYDSKNEDDNRQRVKESRKHNREKEVGEKNNQPNQPSKDSTHKTYINSTSKAPLRNSTKGYIVRGNVKENQYHIRHPYSTQHKSSLNSSAPSNQGSFGLTKSPHNKIYEKPSLQAQGSTNYRQNILKSAPFKSIPFVKSPTQPGIMNGHHQRIEGFGSMGSINNNTYDDLLRENGNNSRISNILSDVYEREKPISQSQSLPHRCPDYIHHCCFQYCHEPSRSVPSCWIQHFPITSTIRPESPSKGRKTYSPPRPESPAKGRNSYSPPRPDSPTKGRNSYSPPGPESPSKVTSSYSTSKPSITRPRGSSVKSWNQKEYDEMQMKSGFHAERKQTSVLEKRIHTLEKRLHSLQKDLNEYKSSEETLGTESEISVKSQCRNVERELQILCRSLHHIRGVS